MKNKMESLLVFLAILTAPLGLALVCFYVAPLYPPLSILGLVSGSWGIMAAIDLSSRVNVKKGK